MKNLILILLLGIIIVPNTFGAVGFTSATNKTPTTAASLTYTSYAVSGTNPVIILLNAINSDTATVSSVACSAGLTCGTPVEVVTIRNVNESPATYLSHWCIPAPSGTGTITVTFSASVPYQAASLLLSGADQSAPCPTGVGNVGTTFGNTPNPLTITLANLTSGEIGVGLGAQADSGDAPSFDQTQTFINNTTNINASGGYRTGAGAMSVTWGTPTTSDTLAVLRVIAAGGGGGGTPTRQLMMGIGK